MESENRSLLGTLVTWAIVAVAVVVAIKLAFWLLGVVFGIVGFATGLAVFVIFRVVPLLIVVWLVMKVIKYFRRETSTI